MTTAFATFRTAYNTLNYYSCLKKGSPIQDIANLLLCVVNETMKIFSSKLAAVAYFDFFLNYSKFNRTFIQGYSCQGVRELNPPAVGPTLPKKRH
jgi:hypothetical protein